MPKGIYQHKSLGEEHRVAISKALLGNKNFLGHKHSKETREKLSRIRIGNQYNKGKLRSLEVRRRLSEIHKANGTTPPHPIGADHHNWRGGLMKNRAYQNFRSRLNIYRRKSALGAHTFEEWENLKKYHQWKCLSCKLSEPEITLTVDHIIPIILGGSNNIDNIQPLCKRCNSSKNVKIINYSYA